ncbi:uncharacterized protein LOC141653504 isoform X2 [Silene latifolia]|uniref:uncharacterized protein LOC141653504 isoform X2 n=1 Tax=Silene latifolia TaxID=37657 RepID=UPI003D76DFB3
MEGRCSSCIFKVLVNIISTVQHPVMNLSINLYTISLSETKQRKLNILAELLMFGDRKFYKDWWNVRIFEEYWRMWNMERNEGTTDCDSGTIFSPSFHSSNIEQDFVNAGYVDTNEVCLSSEVSDIYLAMKNSNDR